MMKMMTTLLRHASLDDTADLEASSNIRLPLPPRADMQPTQSPNVRPPTVQPTYEEPSSPLPEPPLPPDVVLDNATPQLLSQDGIVAHLDAWR